MDEKEIARTEDDGGAGKSQSWNDCTTLGRVLSIAAAAATAILATGGLLRIAYSIQAVRWGWC